MGILVFRDRNGSRDFVGRIDYSRGESGSFVYDSDYLARSALAGELGISELLPPDSVPYAADEFGAFFRGLLPEGEVYKNLAQLYQVPQSDYLTLLEQMGCESIGALTFISESANPSEYEPFYEPVTERMIEEMTKDPAGMATMTASSTRLSLAGAQSKIAWRLADGIDAACASVSDWAVPRGTAPSTHIVKVSRKGEESIATNELVCSLLSQACGIETAKVTRFDCAPGVICVERYDRVRVPAESRDIIVRLHQEDFCQALGFAPFLKYQPQGSDANYPAIAAEFIERVSSRPVEDKLEFAKRLVFSYAIGNSDAHLKNFSMLYGQSWTNRSLAPQYDVTCIPLTGYSTDMSFDVGDHRRIAEIDARDILILASDLNVGLASFDETVRAVVKSLESPVLRALDDETERMVARILDNSAPRIGVLKSYLG